MKKPAGAVSLFGGIDLLAEMNRSTEEGGGVKREAPPTSRKPRKSSSGSGLFMDMEDGEEDIFAFSGRKRFVYTRVYCTLVSSQIFEKFAVPFHYAYANDFCDAESLGTKFSHCNHESFLSLNVAFF